MGFGNDRNKWEVYGKWVSIKHDPKDPHKLVITLFRNKPMKVEYIQKMNTLYDGKNITFWVETNENYDRIHEIIAREVAKKNQDTLKVGKE